MSAAAPRAMSRQVQRAFAERTITKRYLAVVAGPIKDTGQLRGKVRSKLRGHYRWLPASLEYRKLVGDARLSLVEVTPRGFVSGRVVDVDRR